MSVPSFPITMAVSSKWDLYIEPHPRLGKITQEEVERMQDEEESGNMLSSRYDVAAALRISQRLWLSAQGRHEIKPVSSPA